MNISVTDCLPQEHLSLKKYIVDIVTDGSVSSESVRDEEERQKARKRAKKLRARMNSRSLSVVSLITNT